MSNKRQVLQKLAEAGRNGLSDDWLCNFMPDVPPSTVRGCRKQLERSGLCELMKPKWRVSIWKITELGRKYLRLGQTLPVNKRSDTEGALLNRVAEKLSNCNEMTCRSAHGAGWLCRIKRSDGSRCFNYFSAPSLTGAISAALEAALKESKGPK